MICVIATIDVLPGRRKEFMAAFDELAPKVRAEKGCIEYLPLVDLPTSIPGQPPINDNVVTLVEKWESVAALETHLVAPHMAAFRKQTAALRAGIALRILQNPDVAGD
jgi:quinol monooxygenase YgiN